MTWECIWGCFFPHCEIKTFLFYHFLWKCVHWLAKQLDSSRTTLLFSSQANAFSKNRREASVLNFYITSRLKCPLTRIPPAHYVIKALSFELGEYLSFNHLSVKHSSIYKTPLWPCPCLGLPPSPLVLPTLPLQWELLWLWAKADSYTGRKLITCSVAFCRFHDKGKAQCKSSERDCDKGEGIGKQSCLVKQCIILLWGQLPCQAAQTKPLGCSRV